MTPIMQNTDTDTTTLAREQLLAGLRGVSDAYVGREPTVRALARAALTGEHVLLLGPPGTAKSALTRDFVGLFKAEMFALLLGSFTPPEEIFGPLDIGALQQGRMSRLTAGYLPTASFSFLDEIFKANGGLLNSCLTALNERKLRLDGQEMDIPLISCVGASNELPNEDDNLGALYDRFAARIWISDSTALELREILDDRPTPPSGVITLAQLAQCQQEAAQVVVPGEMKDLMIKLRQTLAESNIKASARRWRALLKVLKAEAWLDGEPEVNEDHFGALMFSLGDDPEKDYATVREACDKLGSPLLGDVEDLRETLTEAMTTRGPVPQAGTDPSTSATWMSKAGDYAVTLERIRRNCVELTMDYAEAKPSRATRSLAALTAKVAEETQNNLAAMATRYTI